MTAPMKGVYRGIVPGPFPSFDQYYRKVLYYRPLAFWPQWEAFGAVSRSLVNTAQNGAYVGVTLGQPGIGDGNTCPWFDGANDYNNIWTAALAAAFDSGEGTVAIWGRVANAGVWTDGLSRLAIGIRADPNNRLDIRKDPLNNILSCLYRAGAVSSSVNHATNTLDWFHAAMTWSASTGPTGEVRFYFNGAQTGATQVGLGAWVGLPGNVNTCIGAFSTAPTLVFHGWLAHGAIWTRPLAPAEIADLAVI